MAPPWHGIAFGVEDDWLAAAESTFSLTVVKNSPVVETAFQYRG